MTTAATSSSGKPKSWPRCGARQSCPAIPRTSTPCGPASSSKSTWPRPRRRPPKAKASSSTTRTCATGPRSSWSSSFRKRPSDSFVPAAALRPDSRHNAHVSPPDRARPRATVRAHTGRSKNASACRRRRQGRQHGGQVAAHGLERGGNTVFLRRILVFHAFVFPVLVFSVFVFHILLGRRQQLRPRQGLDRRRRAARALMDLPAAAERPVKQNQIQGDVALGLSRRVLLLHFEILRREQAVGEDAI